MPRSHPLLTPFRSRDADIVTLPRPRPAPSSSTGAQPESVTHMDLLAGIEDSMVALRRYARVLVRNSHDADDLVHDVLVRALDHMSTKRPDDPVRPWLFTIMHNLHVSRLRQARVRGNTVPLEDVHDAHLGRQPGQEDALHAKETMDILVQLPEEQRQVLLLVTVEDFTYAEVAAVLGIPIGTVMSRLSRGRERLRQLMGNHRQAALRRVL